MPIYILFNIFNSDCANYISDVTARVGVLRNSPLISISVIFTFFKVRAFLISSHFILATWQNRICIFVP